MRYEKRGYSIYTTLQGTDYRVNITYLRKNLQDNPLFHVIFELTTNSDDYTMLLYTKDFNIDESENVNFALCDYIHDEYRNHKLDSLISKYETNYKCQQLGIRAFEMGANIDDYEIKVVEA